MRTLAAAMLLLAFTAGCGADDPDPGPVHGLDTLSPCAEEDGNVDGIPCIWTDPSDGERWYVDSSEYRN